MTLKTVTTKTLAATTMAAATLVGTSTFATATAASASSESGAKVEAGQTASANPSADVKFDSIGDFLHHYEGKSLANSQDGYQGVSLISRVIEEVYGLDHDAWGNAVDYQKGSIGGQHMAENRFSWNTDHNFENGDILV